MGQWQLTAKTLLTLKQLGFSPEQTRQALSQYCLEHNQHDDLAFMQYLQASPSVTQEHRQQIVARAQLPLVWRPSPQTERALVRQGFAKEVITHYAALFIIRTREERQLLSNSDAAFATFCEHRPKRLPEPMPDNWMPRVFDLESILQTVCPDMDYITGQIGKFIEHHRYSVATDWDDRFMLWIERGWNAQVLSDTAT